MDLPFVSTRCSLPSARPMQTSAQSCPGSSLGPAVDVEDPAAVGRPARAEVEVARFRRDADPVRTIGVTRPDLVTLRACEMVSDPFAVGTQAQAIGKSLAGPRELARVRPVEANAEDLADVLPHDLHEQPVSLPEQEEPASRTVPGDPWCRSLSGSRSRGRESRYALGSACNTR